MRAFLTSLMLWCFASAASAQVPGGVYKIVSEDVTATAVTIYPDDLALITEVRRVNVPAGRSVIAFEGVSDLIIPQSLVLREFTGLTLERNFDYDLLGKTSLFEKSVGQMITLTRLDKTSGVIKTMPATILSARRDSGVVVSVDGRTEVLSCSGLSERTQFDGLPRGLNPKPVMSIEVSAETAGEQELVISYLASGLGWRADYRLDVNEAATKASMLGWLTLTNRSAKSFEGVSLSIIAGDLNRRPETRAVSPPTPYLRAQCYPRGSTKRGIAERVQQLVKTVYRRQNLYAPAPEMMSMAMDDEIVVTGTRISKEAVQENVGDYKLYRVPGAVSVMANQTKQIAFLNKAEVELERYALAEVYSGTVVENPQPLLEVYEIDNSRAGALSAPLPKGTMRLFAKGARGQVVFIGEDSVDNLAIEEPVRLKLGQSMNMQMRGSFDTLARENGDYQIAQGAFAFYNATDDAARVKFVLKDSRLRGDIIDQQSHPRDGAEIEPTWFITVPPEGSDTLSFGIGTDIIYMLDLDPLYYLDIDSPTDIAQDLEVVGRVVLRGTRTPIEDLGLDVSLTGTDPVSAVTVIRDVLDNEDGITAHVTHTLTNRGQDRITMTIAPSYSIVDSDQMRFSEASQSIERIDGGQGWRVMLDAGADMVLSYRVSIMN